MNTTIADIMVARVMTATPHQTVGHVRDVLAEHGVSCLPVVDPERKPIGIVTAADILGCGDSEASPISHVMSTNVFTVPRYADVSLAARVMRNHSVHHVPVTDEGRVVGIVSSFDLLALVEEHRFVMKNAPDVSRKRKRRSPRPASE